MRIASTLVVTQRNSNLMVEQTTTKGLQIRRFDSETDTGGVASLLERNNLRHVGVEYSKLSPKYTIVIEHPERGIIGMVTAMVQEGLMAYIPYLVVDSKFRRGTYTGRMVNVLKGILRDARVKVVVAVWGLSDMDMIQMAYRYGFKPKNENDEFSLVAYMEKRL